jgi:hypothetical protein
MPSKFEMLVRGLDDPDLDIWESAKDIAETYGLKPNTVFQYIRAARAGFPGHREYLEQRAKVRGHENLQALRESKAIENGFRNRYAQERARGYNK